MYIYNVTVNIETSIEQEWLNWMEYEHIPKMLATGKFFEAKMCQVMVEEEIGITYSIQYTTEDKETLERYYNENADALRQEAITLFGSKLVSFRSELRVVNHVKNFIKS